MRAPLQKDGTAKNALRGVGSGRRKLKSGYMRYLSEESVEKQGMAGHKREGFFQEQTDRNVTSTLVDQRTIPGGEFI